MTDQGKLPASVEALAVQVEEAFGARRPKIVRMFRNCIANTLETTVNRMTDGTTFVITGDIPAMWLRDSAAQVRTYLLAAAHDEDLAAMIEGVVRRQLRYILHDPYANAFNEDENGKSDHLDDRTAMTPLLWERKYEVDSLCYPLQLSWLLWKETGRTSHLDATFARAARSILDVFRIEQDHANHSSYTFERTHCPPTDTLSHDGKGTPVVPTGMTWSGFRPSDDACTYGYLVPSNWFAVVALGYLGDIAESVLQDASLASDARDLAAEIRQGIQAHALVQHPTFGEMYAYETDGMGHYNLMDDANVPSLLSLPYLGACDVTDPTYQNTRRFVLSSENPFFYEGTAARGVGSPHTPKRFIWHIALCMQGLTSMDEQERGRILDWLETTDGGTDFMHEGFNVDDPSQFTRSWFSWANSLFSEFVLDCAGIRLKSAFAKPE